MTITDLESAYLRGDRGGAVSAASSVGAGETLDHGRTAVHLAAEKVDPEVMGILLGNGCRAGATDEYGRTPLHVLAVQRWEGMESRMAECTDLLLSHRCPPGRRDDSGMCFYHIACKMANHPMLSVVGRRGVRCDALLDGSGMNALHVLCYYADYDFDHEHHPDVFAEKDERCRQMAEWLVGCGIDPDAETAIGRKAVDFAVSHRLSRTAAFLRGGPEGAGGMDLFQASQMNDAGAVACLLAAGGDPDSTCDRPGDFRGMTPLMIACRTMSADSAAALIEGGADARASDGTTGRTAMYHLLMALGSTVGTGRNDRGSGAFLRLLRLLLDAQGSPDFPVGTSEGSALCFVCGRDFLGWTSDGRSVRTVAFDAVSSSGADVEARDGAGRTPLIAACCNGGAESENIVSSLMELGADPDARDSDGMTAVMRASGLRGNSGLDLIKTIYDFGSPDLSVVGKDGLDAIGIAAREGNNEVLKYLMSR